MSQTSEGEIVNARRNLACAVIAQAVEDWKQNFVTTRDINWGAIKEDAGRFLFTDRFEIFVEHNHINLNIGWFRRELLKSNYHAKKYKFCRGMAA